MDARLRKYFEKLPEYALDTYSFDEITRREGEAAESFRARLIEFHESIGSVIVDEAEGGGLLLPDEYRPPFDHAGWRKHRFVRFWLVCVFGGLQAAVIFFGAIYYIHYKGSAHYPVLFFAWPLAAFLAVVAHFNYKFIKWMDRAAARERKRVVFPRSFGSGRE